MVIKSVYWQESATKRRCGAACGTADVSHVTMVVVVYFFFLHSLHYNGIFQRFECDRNSFLLRGKLLGFKSVFLIV